MQFKAALAQVSNRGAAPLEFLNELVKWADTARDEIFAPRKDDPGETDVYTAVASILGPWTGLPHRKAAMLEILRVLAGFESSWTWDQDYDKHNPDENTSLKKSAGAFQVSANSMTFGSDLKALVASVVGTLDPDAFRSAMRSNRPLAVEYIARLLRHLIRHNGPVKRGEINRWLSRDAVKEFQAALTLVQSAGPQPPAPAVVPETPATPVGSDDKVDARSEANIATLHTRMQPLARQLVKDAATAGIVAKVTSGTRTYAEQDALYEQGRSKSGGIVTNARGGYSNHNFGVAFDLTVFSGATPVWDGPQYKILGALGKKLGLEWGGGWTNIEDEPHFELRPGWAEGLSEGQMLAGLRVRHADGRDAFA